MDCSTGRSIPGEDCLRSWPERLSSSLRKSIILQPFPLFRSRALSPSGICMNLGSKANRRSSPERLSLPLLRSSFESITWSITSTYCSQLKHILWYFERSLVSMSCGIRYTLSVSLCCGHFPSPNTRHELRRSSIKILTPISYHLGVSSSGLESVCNDCIIANLWHLSQKKCGPQGMKYLMLSCSMSE